jgi:hypothetical protein
MENRDEMEVDKLDTTGAFGHSANFQTCKFSCPGIEARNQESIWSYEGIPATGRPVFEMVSHCSGTSSLDYIK